MKKIILAALALVGIWFFSCDDSEKSKPAVEPKGNIQVSSTPSGADIYLDNVKTENSTPFTFTDLDTGLHEIRLSKSGYFDDSIMVRVEEGLTATPSVTLTSQSTPVGSIFVNSVPSGASIFLDGNTTGKITPDTLKSIITGDHQIKLTSSGYADSTFSVTVSENLTSSQSVTMRALHFGNLFISSTPSGAAIFLDGNNSGKVTPDTLKNISSGEHTVTLTHAGYADSTFVVNVPNANQTINQSITLRAIPVGNIFVSSEPPGVSIFLDGNMTGKITPDTLKYVITGNHQIKLTSIGYADSTFSVIVSENLTTSQSITMRVLLYGNISISSTPSGAAIFFDGANSSKFTPDTLKNISSGDHLVKLTLAGYFDSTFTVTVPNANQMISSLVAMQLKKVPLVIQTIFDNHCIGCHSGSTPPQGQNLSEDFAYLHIVNVTSKENSGLKRILPGDPNNSYLVRKIEGTGITGERMPRGGPYLSQAQIDSVRSWVSNGALPR